MLEFATSLRGAGITTGILSNVILATRDDIRSRDGYAGFDPLFLSCEIGFAKPDKVIYQLMLEKLILRPEEVVFIDDMEKNLVPAHALGIHVILCQSSEQIIADTNSLLRKENGNKL